jgi:hypothetical protein
MLWWIVVLFTKILKPVNTERFQAVYSLQSRINHRLSFDILPECQKDGLYCMGAKRWAEEGIQEGTFYDAYGTYLGIEKMECHTITLMLLGLLSGIYFQPKYSGSV